MPRRSRVSLDDVGDWSNLSAAFWRAAKGKLRRPEVQRFRANLTQEIAALRRSILAAELPVGDMVAFEIRDPKRRTIHAPCFSHRVLHHALMHHLAPVIERSLVADTYACIPGRGTLAAVRRAQHHARRFDWYVKTDVASYFANIEHERLLGDLERRFKDAGVLALCRRIVQAHQVTPGCGLPIGALTSQHFANLYLAPLDRYLLEGLRVDGMVRYMDDTLWWTSGRSEAREQLREVVGFLERSRGLTVKSNWQINRSDHGIPFCGFRVYAGALHLSLRRKRRFRLARRRWEDAYLRGQIDANALQAGYQSARSIIAHADAREWCRRELAARPPCDA